MIRVGQNLYVRYIYGVFGREITKYTVIYGVNRYTVLANIPITVKCPHTCALDSMHSDLLLFCPKPLLAPHFN
jgi:hypothetical protein